MRNMGWPRWPPRGTLVSNFTFMKSETILLENFIQAFKNSLVLEITSNLSNVFAEKLLNSKEEGFKTKLLNIDQIAELLGVSKSTIIKLRKEGLPVIAIEKTVRYDPVDVIAFIKQKNQKPP